MKILRKAVACTALLIMTSVAGAIPVTVMNGTHDMVNGTLAGHLGLSFGVNLWMAAGAPTLLGFALAVWMFRRVG